jgi:hypothetical protein
MADPTKGTLIFSDSISPPSSEGIYSETPGYDKQLESYDSSEPFFRQSFGVAVGLVEATLLKERILGESNAIQLSFLDQPMYLDSKLDMEAEQVCVCDADGVLEGLPRLGSKMQCVSQVIGHLIQRDIMGAVTFTSESEAFGTLEKQVQPVSDPTQRPELTAELTPKGVMRSITTQYSETVAFLSSESIELFSEDVCVTLVECDLHISKVGLYAEPTQGSEVTGSFLSSKYPFYALPTQYSETICQLAKKQPIESEITSLNLQETKLSANYQFRGTSTSFSEANAEILPKNQLYAEPVSFSDVSGWIYIPLSKLFAEATSVSEANVKWLTSKEPIYATVTSISDVSVEIDRREILYAEPTGVSTEEAILDLRHIMYAALECVTESFAILEEENALFIDTTCVTLSETTLDAGTDLKLEAAQDSLTDSYLTAKKPMPAEVTSVSEANCPYVFTRVKIFSEAVSVNSLDVGISYLISYFHCHMASVSSCTGETKQYSYCFCYPTCIGSATAILKLIDYDIPVDMASINETEAFLEKTRILYSEATSLSLVTAEIENNWKPFAPVELVSLSETAGDLAQLSIFGLDCTSISEVSATMTRTADLFSDNTSVSYTESSLEALRILASVTTSFSSVDATIIRWEPLSAVASQISLLDLVFVPISKFTGVATCLSESVIKVPFTTVKIFSEAVSLSETIGQVVSILDDLEVICTSVSDSYGELEEELRVWADQINSCQGALSISSLGWIYNPSLEIYI